MKDCEICGGRRATVKAKIESTILSVCQDCASSGEIIEELHKQKPKEGPKIIIIPPEETLVEGYGNIIAQARQKLELKQEELALKLSIKLSELQNAEAEKKLDLTTAKKLEKFLGIKITETTEGRVEQIKPEEQAKPIPGDANLTVGDLLRTKK